MKRRWRKNTAGR